MIPSEKFCADLRSFLRQEQCDPPLVPEVVMIELRCFVEGQRNSAWLATKRWLEPHYRDVVSWLYMARVLMCVEGFPAERAIEFIHGVLNLVAPAPHEAPVVHLAFAPTNGVREVRERAA